jgi:TIM-barrel protein
MGVKNPSMLAAMSGITNGDFSGYCLDKGSAGFVTIGGYSIGKKMISATIKSSKRGRNEFILKLGEEAREIFKETSKISKISNVFINLRLDNIHDAKKFSSYLTDLLGKNQPILEINAHCRQMEIIRNGGGQNLLRRVTTLEEIIKIIQSKDFKVSLKIRGNAVSSASLIPNIKRWQLDFLHIDSYREGIKGTDLKLLNCYTKALDVTIIGNNSVIDLQSARAILGTGAEYFSIARAAKKDPLIFKNIIESL